MQKNWSHRVACQRRECTLHRQGYGSEDTRGLSRTKCTGIFEDNNGSEYRQVMLDRAKYEPLPIHVD